MAKRNSPEQTSPTNNMFEEDARPTVLSDDDSHANRGCTQINKALADQMGSYCVVSVIGHGGFGTVYKAFDRELEREVALKVLTNPMDKRGLKQFHREAKVIAALGKHPGIVQIFSYGEFDGKPYLVLDYVETNAQQLLDKSPKGLSVDIPLRIAQQAAAALGYAHDRGILHRDVKPANILLEAADLSVKLADFGLSRILDQHQAHASMNIMGTPVYMAPEQVAGDKLDGRCDVYALGVTLYQLLSGKLPFDGDSSSAVFERIRMNKRTPLENHRPDLPRDIIEAVEKAAAHDINQRFQSAWDFEETLAQLRKKHCGAGDTDRIVRARTHRSTTLRWGKVASVPLVLVFILAGIVFLLTARSNTADAQLMEAARDKMDASDYASAQKLYSQAVSDFGSPEARYGLGFAELKLGKLEAAGTAFSGIPESSGLRPEALAAFTVETNPAATPPELEEVARHADYRYAVALIARLNLLRQQYPETISRLESLKPGDFYFAWQYEEARQLLAQALYKLGKMEEARQLFGELATGGDPRVQSMARAYISTIELQERAKRSAEVSEKLQSIKKLLAEKPALTEVDTWTSRPLSVLLLPIDVDANSSPSAVAAGIPDVLNELIAGQLKTTNLRVVDRELIQAILAEQELSATLSTEGEGQLQLMRIIGARILVSGRVLRYGKTEKLMLKAVDIERTSEWPVRDPEIGNAIDLEALAAEAAKNLAQMAAESYPLQARLYAKDEKVQINIGSEVGLRPGTVFEVMEDKGDPALSGIFVRAESVGTATAAVAPQGIEAAALPHDMESAWYVREKKEEDRAEAKSGGI